MQLYAIQMESGIPFPKIATFVINVEWQSINTFVSKASNVEKQMNLQKFTQKVHVEYIKGSSLLVKKK